MADTPADTATLNDDNVSHEREHRSPRHVDDVVLRAEAEFDALSRQLTKHSVGARQSLEKVTDADPEKGQEDIEESFDLREYLTSSNDANQRAGIKHKVCTPCSPISSSTLSFTSECWCDLGGFASRGSWRSGEQGV